MKINLMLPTRKRVERCYTFCKSAMETVADVNNIQVSIVTDLADDTHDQLVERLKEFPFVVFLERADVNEFPGLVWYWNFILERTMDSTDIIGMVGDDMVFRDKGWDQDVVDYFNGIPDKIGMIHFNEGGPHGARMCINSFVHKRWVEVLKHYNDIRLKGDFSDNFIFDIATGIGRKKYVSDKVIEHMHWMINNKGVKDDTADRRVAVDGNLQNNMTSLQFYHAHSLQLVKQSIIKLKAYMHGFNK